MSTADPFSECKVSGHEAEDPPPSSPDGKNAWSYTSTPHKSSWHNA